MSVRYELAEFYDTAVDRTEDFGYQVADTARRGLCTLWSTLPGALIPNPGDAFRRGALSALCQDFPPPPPPSIPFTGGQCPGVLYSATVRATRNGQTVNNAGVQGLGPIGLRVEQTDNSSPANPDGRTRQAYATFGGGQQEISAGSGDQLTSFALVNVVRVDGNFDTCGNPPTQYPGPTEIDDRDTTFEGDTIVEGDEVQNITVDFSPTFEDEVCIGQFVFCADVEGNRVTLDLGGVTINLPGTGGGDQGGGGDGGNGDTITNIDTKVTNIQEAQEECCAAIIQSISSFRNRATELFNEAELRDACIVGLIRNSTNLVPRFVGPTSIRASGSSGVLGSVRYVQPSRGDSCFLIIEVTPTPSYQGKRYKILDDGQLVEASFGHAELVFLDGTTVSPSETGIRTLSNRKTFVWFPYVSSGNAIRLSLAGGLDYEVTDPGFRWSPSDLPTCEEVIDPGA